MHRALRASSPLLAFALVVSASPARSEGVREDVEAGNRAFVAAFLGGDAKAVAALYTQDAQVIAPGSPLAKGRTDIESFWQGMIDSGFESLALETVEVETAGDLAYEVGNVRPLAADGTASEARYVVVWKRVAGRRLLHRDIWNAGE